jgi:hypothetical protein
VAPDERLDQVIVVCERRAHGVRVLLPVTGTGLNVGEQEGHRAGRQRACMCRACRGANPVDCAQQLSAISFAQLERFG